MKEDFLHTIWEYQLFINRELKTTENTCITILNKGRKNFHDGPDFLEAKIKIDKTIWVGQIEIHVNSSDWVKHQHSEDKRYRNVILHLVWNHDIEIPNFHAPTLELKGFVPKKYLDNYHLLAYHKSTELPCHDFVTSIDENWLKFYQERLLWDRFQEKSKRLFHSQEDRSQLIFETFCYALGLKANGENMKTFAERIPIYLILKIRHKTFSLEALFLGIAGFLHAHHHFDYASKLYQEFLYLKKLYKIPDYPPIFWIHKGIRPQAFPLIRLAFLAQLFSKIDSLDSFVLDTHFEKFSSCLQGLELPEFYNTHYTLEKESPEKQKHLGQQSVFTLWINAVLPSKLYYTECPEEVFDKIVSELKTLKPEKNKLTIRMKENYFENSSAFHSQANIHLYKEYCIERKCLNCHIGIKILKQ
ncbi:MAG: DUF2851 family protein [Flavobacteriales bacterium]|jgi:hypothetical protein|nr:DUF2851 family protein [Flavobacteriales bacterium]